MKEQYDNLLFSYFMLSTALSGLGRSGMADGTKAVTEIREPGFVTRVWWCLGSPCFNKHLDAERGACPLRRSLVEITNGLHHNHTTHVLVIYLWKCFCPKQTFPQSLTGASPLCRPAAASLRVGLGPGFTALTQEPIKGCLGIPGLSPSEISFIIAPSYHGRGAARPISVATTYVHV
ncbi:hypothetical protein GOODEAATRI_000729 [Goodea atripinnis]|uniref:Uncharacterized protein n=1 Tax=Goodea atripinnis TaxID=208336 RepID=A0ABV0N6V1_9TELE